ncbi:MAG TPA: nucleotidyltransferase [Clostridiaceae bacterium]|mgnify:CR=1 FL=1|nr:nucleotidyltransferase [Clostridiaceae bacterium]
MSVVGVIAEYNPLHLGHVHHLNYARSATKAQGLVCVLSSNFVQRGEPAIVSKWVRTRMALVSGADLVVELPSAFSCASAEYFAAGAVSILNNLGIIDHLCFGSEEGCIGILEAAADQFVCENQSFKENLKTQLSNGHPYALARQKALKAVLLNNETDSLQKHYDKAKINNIISAVNKPNNILGIEYIKALKRLKSTIKPMTAKRIGQDYNSLERAASFSSATSIRQYIQEKTAIGLSHQDDAFLFNNMAEQCLELMFAEFSSGRGPVFPEAFENILLYAFRTKSISEIRSLPYIEEGLENRLKQAAMESTSYNEFIAKVVTKRYPASRIKRILISMLTGMTEEFLEELKCNGYAQYIRVLGFNETGRILLSEIKNKAQLPIITKPASYNNLDNKLAVKLFEHEVRSTNTYVLGYHDTKYKTGNQEYTCSPIYHNENKNLPTT